MNIIAIASQKGGVGKTTVAINLSYSLAVRGYSVILIDTDPQGSVGHSLSRDTKKRYGFYDAILDGKPFDELLIKTKLPNYQLITSGSNGDYFDEFQINSNICLKRINHLFERVRSTGVDFVFVDTVTGEVSSGK